MTFAASKLVVGAVGGLGVGVTIIDSVKYFCTAVRTLGILV